MRHWLFQSMKAETAVWFRLSERLSSDKEKDSWREKDVFIKCITDYGNYSAQTAVFAAGYH